MIWVHTLYVSVQIWDVQYNEHILIVGVFYLSKKVIWLYFEKGLLKALNQKMGWIDLYLSNMSKHLDSQ